MPFHLIVVAIGGVVAGIIGTAGGITSLVAYPLLLAVGIPPLTANVTSSVALLGSGVGGTLRARPDLVGHRRTLERWIPVSVAGAILGAVLLLVTPPDLFGRIVPFLVAAGAVLLLLQPRISRWQGARDRAPQTGSTKTASPKTVPSQTGPSQTGPSQTASPQTRKPRTRAMAAAITGVTVYDGYFGAGSGVLMIAVLLLTVEPQLHRANALKNVILVAADIVPAVLFAIFGHVVWSAALALGAGALVGGLIGPSVARKVPRDLLRILIAICGFALAVYLFVT